MGMTQGLPAATAPADLRGPAYGLFNLVSGLAMLLASLVTGWMWDSLGAPFTFYTGAAFCLLTLLVLLWRTGSTPGP
ncbi:hypothetical protein ACWIJ6_08715 [Aeromonas piscicola]